MTARTADIVVIGGGHNGLVCATLLAKAGRKVVLVEAAEALGGAARTVEFGDGCRVSQVAHVLNQLHPEVEKKLELKRHGLQLAATNIPTTALAADGRHLTLHGPFGERLEGDVSAEDQAAWKDLRAKLMRFAAVLRPALTDIPPRLKNGSRGDMMALGKLGLGIRRLGRADMREFLRMMLMNVADVLNEEIGDDRLKGAVAFDAVLGTHLGPLSPNSLMTLYYRLAGEADGMQGALALPKGGMGSVVSALEAAARAAGVEVLTGAPVSRILVENDRVSGVKLENGEEIRATTVVSGANPRTTLIDLLGTCELDTGLVRRVSNIRMRGNVARLHLAVEGLPDFRGLSEGLAVGRLLVAPSIMEIETAFNPVKYGSSSPVPALEIVIPSLSDPALAPSGRHVVSINALYAAYDPKAARKTARTAFQKSVMKVLEQHAPGIGEQVVASEAMMPADIEEACRMPGGHWHHGELAIDQMFMLRPVHGLAQYAAPVPGLYLCGAGSHPGGGVMGAAGMNAARRILSEAK
ncbi:NAD(P)/FAD-dependent oxidoreductase [Microbaculum marinum]|uniref:Pyridine nucleotide-disulfide oxidoreductase domain-containing protein 2 n=1 Tax=Microbaculum marinum TaxID=1764581 RepID=A0AAW9RD69_9HYPH